MDLTALLPAVIGFFVVAGVAVAMAVAALVVLATDARRRATGPAVPMSAARAAVASPTRRAA